MTERTYAETAAFVPPAPQLPALPTPQVTDVDPRAVVRDGMRANGELIANMLRTIAPAQLTTERKRAERAEAALAAVPVVAIDCIYDDARLENETPEVQAIWMQIGDWLASLESA